MKEEFKTNPIEILRTIPAEIPNVIIIRDFETKDVDRQGLCTGIKLKTGNNDIDKITFKTVWKGQLSGNEMKNSRFAMLGGWLYFWFTWSNVYGFCVYTGNKDFDAYTSETQKTTLQIELTQGGRIVI